ncbi:MAG: hypothetical protein GY835_16695 [bacterium]|nr:hypothetical protein [bacterium]
MGKRKIVKRILTDDDCCGVDMDTIKEELRGHGIELDDLCGDTLPEGAKVKVVCISPNVKSSVDELGKAPRDNVLMVRIDEETNRMLDAWVEAGAVKSRSQAAALFIREGLKVRSSELEQLREALEQVDEARDNLRRKAREVFGETTDEPESPR